jgi:putative ABC transport system permease protein
MSVDLFHRDVVEKLSSKPGTTAVAITTALPATDVTPLAAYTVEGVRAEDWKLEFAAFAVVYGDYFRAMGIPVLDGRTFTSGDRADTALVVVVNETMAKHCWPGQRAVGKRIHLGNPQKGLPWATVVGVVADTAAGSRDEPKRSQWYLAAEQPAMFSGPAPRGPRAYPDAGYIALRSALPPERMIETLRSTVAEVDPLLALQDVKPMDAVMSDVEAPRRFNTDLITAFALGALLLAMTGIYAVVAFSVSLRTQEIAIRMAVGAQRKSIARLVLVSGGKLALLGCVLGVAGSLAVSRLVETFLFDVSAKDPWIYGAGVVVMLLVALAASAIPAMRAAAADPAKALRAT